DTYWSDHCRHTTFLTELKKVTLSTPNKRVEEGYETYLALFKELYKERNDKYPCLMDVATIGAKKLKKEGYLNDLDLSDEINACSICVTVMEDGEPVDYVVMFKNETHNHPTEIEPFGGAATCLGGAIRDPLSGRTYVYQSMRITGAADPRVAYEQTLKGKLPQRTITKGATAGFSSYGNQIGLCTGQVVEVYHPGYVAKRLETGFVVGAAKKENIYREKPKAGDVVILLGGDTGRDGCGGATGSSKAHSVDSVAECGAEVQKGNPITERKIQRLFRKKEVTTLIKKCNDFGAGGVSVAIGELADGLIIELDKVPKKYEGLTGTELAISESQERMAVVVSAENAARFIEACAVENLNAVVVATVTEAPRMVMTFNGKTIVDLPRAFLDTNGVKQEAEACLTDAVSHYCEKVNAEAEKLLATDVKAALVSELSRLNVCSQRGMGEQYDSSIGAGSVLLPFGGKTQLTPAVCMAAKIPVAGETTTCTAASYGFNPFVFEESCFTGAVYSVLLSMSKLAAAGVNTDTVRLTFQEYFLRLKEDPSRWGKPLSALLGALYAQLGFKAGSIGGKDSMSGTFEDIDVPSTLISFALGIADTREILHNVFTEADKKVYRLHMKTDEYGVPDLNRAKAIYRALYAANKAGKVSWATVVEEGGAFAAIAKSAIGNRIGFAFDCTAEEALRNTLGDILIITEDIDAFKEFAPTLIGTTVQAEVLSVQGVALSLDEAQSAFTGALESVYPTRTAPVKTSYPEVAQKAKTVSVIANPVKPKVFIPVFPGTNCETDSARRFRMAGAEVQEFVVKNRTPSEIEQSVAAMAKAINQSQIVMFAGGFSGGDEPDGSGKLIAATFRSPALSDAMSDLLEVRGGLALGICNGFQVLVKLGLVPYGKITDLQANSPTLTFNRIGHHMSQICRVRVASNLSPWLNACKTGEVYSVPISHGEGRFICTDEDLAALAKNGQIATQYCTDDGLVSAQIPFCPNASVAAIEGITSPDGRVFGKMGHAERIGEGMYKNYEGNFDMKIFESGVRYFK
ncbi:MAG: phosphoribosylformylglycinamidine synthase, partial [Clostridia bacterium]|nr:phosphoribosylformylglycinamidine synthase [Clostridia bacterium]